MGWRTTAWGRTAAEIDRGRWVQESQVSSNEYRGQCCKRDGLGEISNASEGWSGGSKGVPEESDMEEYGVNAGEPEGTGDTRAGVLS